MKTLLRFGFNFKSIATLILILCGISSIAQVNLSDPISVTDFDNSYNNRSPRVSVNSDGEPIVFWMDNSSDEMYLSTLENNVFSEPTSIPLNGINPNLWSGSLGPNMVSNGDQVYVVFEKYGNAIYISHSSDGGQTWDNPVAAYTPPPNRRATIPIVAVDSDGQPFVAYTNTNINEEDAYYGMVKSVDFGQTFSEETNVSSEADGAEVCECCNGHIEVATNGNIYVAFRNNDNNERDMWLAVSTDGGDTFSSAFDIDQTDWIAQVCPSSGPNFTILEDEIVTVFYSGSGMDASDVFYSDFETLTNEPGVTYPLQSTDETSSGQNRPKVSGGSNTIGAVWQESFAGDYEIAMSISTSGSEGLNTNNFRITDMEGHQQYPDIYFDGNSFHVVYKEGDSGTVFYQNVSINTNGIAGLENSNFTIGPNPSNGILNIELLSSSIENITITDALGKVVFQQLSDGQNTQLDISNLTPGMYLVSLNNQQAQKLIVR